MGRKRFYTLPDEEKVQEFEGWKAAKYIRLSRFDNDNVESYSVANQRKLINSYIEEHDDIVLSEEFIDDDWTGTNFNRPGFQRMMDEIKKGSINCIILKDLSRFGRNYIEAGKLLEETLPAYGCRVISIIDDVDSFKDTEAAMSIMVRIKNLIHDHNSMETSKKVRESKDIMRREGKNISPPPFGYIRDPKDKYKLIIDEDPAEVIRMIFNFYIKGMGIIRISQKLNNLGIVTRRDYSITGSVYKVDNFEYSKNGWRPNSVRQILSNKTYIGAMDQKRWTTRNYKDRRRVDLEDKDHIIVYDTHEPIIQRDVFDKVQEQLSERCTGTSKYKEKLYLFSGMLRCADCGSSMIRNSTYMKGKHYVYYKCRAYNQRGINVCQRSHSIPENVLTNIVKNTVNAHIQTLVDIKHVISVISQSKCINKVNFDFEKLIKEKQRQKKELKTLKTNAHMRYLGLTVSDKEAGIVMNKEDLTAMIRSLDERIKSVDNQIEALKTEKKNEEDIRNNEITWLDKILEHGYLKKLNRELTTELIDYIYIGTDKSVRIEFKYQDEYERLAEYINRYAQDTYSEDVM